MRTILLPAALLPLLACGSPPASPPPSAQAPALLLVTLDTTRADHVAPEAPADATPALAALASRGVSFSHAYATAPMTLPAHVSMMTGLYPGGHGIHENGRRVPETTALLAPRLAELGYRTAALVSGAPLDSSYGLDRGFGTYDDELGGRAERDARATTDRALALLPSLGDRAFLWVHYFDPHEPYAPPEPFRSRFPEDPYRGEIAFLDQELGRLVSAFSARYPNHRLLLVGDHGEGRGDHGETFHGLLLYQATMRVPLLIVEGPESAGTPLSPSPDSPESAGTVRGSRRIERPVSTRAVFDTLLGWARGESTPGLLAPAPGLVLGEAMKPYLDYGWQPQWMAVSGTRKVILSGAVETEIYDLAADPAESRNLAPEGAAIDREVRQALADYPLPAAGTIVPPRPEAEAARVQLASLGYLVSEGPRKLRPEAPVPRRMTALFPDLSRASGLFSAGRYAEAVAVFERLLAADPGNFAAALQRAVALGGLGRHDEARAAFERAREIAPDSLDLRHYRGVHALLAGQLDEAERDLEAVVAASPERILALSSLAQVRARQGRLADAADLWRRVLTLDPDNRGALGALGEVAMEQGDTEGAIAAFERLRSLDPAKLGRHLELGVLYLEARRLDEARDSLERVPAGHPGYPMALFKRAQVAVLAGEPDADEWIAKARAGADEVTRPLVARETLFRR